MIQTTTAGAIHRTWIDIKNSFVADKDKSTLQNVVFGEDAAIKAYQKALDSGDLSQESSRTIWISFIISSHPIISLKI